MKKEMSFPLLILLILSLSTMVSVWAQPTQVVVPITATDNANFFTVKIGMASGYDLNRNDPGGVHGDEVELPPTTPSGVFDFRIYDPQEPIRNLFGNGLMLDLREIASSAIQRDTFALYFKSSTDAPPTVFSLSWPAGLADSGGGRGWMLMDDPAIPVPRFAPVNMAEQTSFTHPFPSTSFQKIYIVIGDGAAYRTFEADSLALAKDSKGKYAKPEKRKPIKSEWEITFKNPGATAIVGPVLFTVKFSQNVISLDLPAGVTTDVPVPAKLFTFSKSGGLAGNAEFTIHGFGDKGKAIKVSGKWTASGAKIKQEADAGTLRLVLGMPNLNNVLSEVYAKEGGEDLLVGKASQAQSILHSDWKAVTKSLNKKGTIHTTNPSCLDLYKGKPIKKQMKFFSPAVTDNILVAEVIALKVNIDASENGNTTTGFGNLVYLAQPGDPPSFDSLTVSQIAESLDAHMTLCDTLHTDAEYLAIVQNINSEFAGTFYQEEDTVSYGNGLTVVSPVKPILFSTVLYRSSAEIAPTTGPKNRFVEEMPEIYRLEQNYPNPFNPLTTIEFTLSEDAVVTLKVYNMLGQEVVTLFNREEMTEGSNEVDFDASNLASGVYYYRLIVNDGAFQDIKKMMLLK